MPSTRLKVGRCLAPTIESVDDDGILVWRLYRTKCADPPREAEECELYPTEQINSNRRVRQVRTW